MYIMTMSTYRLTPLARLRRELRQLVRDARVLSPAAPLHAQLHPMGRLRLLSRLEGGPGARKAGALVEKPKGLEPAGGQLAGVHAGVQHRFWRCGTGVEA